MIIDILIISGILFYEIYPLKNKFIDLELYFTKAFIIIIISLTIFLFLVIRRKIYCIIGGIAYLIIGVLYWAYETYYFSKSYLANQNKKIDALVIIVLIANTFLIFLRAICCFIIKKMYEHLKSIEKYLYERDHTIFIQKIENDIDVSVFKDNTIASENKVNE